MTGHVKDPFSNLPMIERYDGWGDQFERLPDVELAQRSMVFAFDRSAIDEDARTVELALSSEEPARQWFGVEILDHSKKSVRLDWLKSGAAPLLMMHDRWEQIGVIEDAWLDSDRVVRCRVRFSESKFADEIFRDVATGIRQCVSAGYRIWKKVLEKDEDDIETYRVTDWELMEGSFVSIPADRTVGVGRSMVEQGETPKTVTVIGTGSQNKEHLERSDPMSPQGNVERPLSTEFEGKGLSSVEREEYKAAARAEVEAELADKYKSDEQRAAENRQAITRFGGEYKDFGMETEALEALHAGREFAPWSMEMMGKIIDRQKSDNKTVRLNEEPGAFLGMEPKEAARFSMRRALLAAANKDWQHAGFERECSQEVGKALGLDARGFFVPLDIWGQVGERVIHTTSTGDTPKAGFLVGTDHRDDMFIELLRPRSVCLGLGARSITGLVGNLAIPGMASGASHYWVAEGGDVTLGNQIMRQVAMSPKTCAMRQDSTRRLLLQSSPSIERLIREDMLKGMATAMDVAIIQGSGTGGEPTGIRNTSGIGSVALGTNGAAMAWGDVVDLETEVAQDDADIGSLAYLTNAQTRGKLKQTEKASNTAQFIWAGGELNGYNAAVSGNMPSNLTKGSGSNLSSMLFGNFDSIMVGHWGVLDIKVDETTLGDSGGLVIRCFQDFDVAMRHVESFAACDDIITL